MCVHRGLNLTLTLLLFFFFFFFALCFSFSTQDLEIPFITAIGSTVELSYHKNSTAAIVALWPVGGQAACVCENPAAPFGAAQGTIKCVHGCVVVWAFLE